MKKLMMIFAFCAALMLGISSSWAEEAKDAPKDPGKKEFKRGGPRGGPLAGVAKEIFESPEGKKEIETHKANMKAIDEERKKLIDTMREEVKKLVGENGEVQDAAKASRATVAKNHEADIRAIVDKRIAEMTRHFEAMLTIGKGKQKEISDAMVKRFTERFTNADGKRGKGEGAQRRGNWKKENKEEAKPEVK